MYNRNNNLRRRRRLGLRRLRRIRPIKQFLMDKGAVVALAEGGEGFATPKHLTKEDGTVAKKGETLDFKVIEFVIILFLASVISVQLK